MFFQAVVTQCSEQLKKRSSLCVFYLLLAMVLANYIDNIRNFSGMDVVDMYQPMKLLLLSYNKTYYNSSLYLLLFQLVPLMVSVPAGMAFAKDEQTGEKVYLAVRMGYQKYLFSRLVSAFLTTFIVFTLPFLVEIGLNCLSFPLTATGDLSNFGYYTAEYVQSVRRYLFAEMYLCSPYMYAFFMTILFGAILGVLAAFTMAISVLFRVKYTAFLILPVFLLMNGSVLLNAGRSVAGKASVNVFHYMMLFNDEIKFKWYLPVMVLGLIIVSVASVSIKSRKDCV